MTNAVFGVRSGAAVRRLLAFGLAFGLFADAGADDHWCDGGTPGTELSITQGAVSVGSSVDVGDLVIVNDDATQTSGSLYLGILASATYRSAGESLANLSGRWLLDVDHHPDRDGLWLLTWVSNREHIRLRPGQSTTINLRGAALAAPPAGTYWLYAFVYEWNDSLPNNGANCFRASWNFQQQVTFGTGATSDDHGDSRSAATRVALPSETAGAIDPGDDEDYFRFEASRRGTVLARTTGGLDTVGALYDSAGRELAADDDSGADTNFRIQRELAAGAYYVRVSSYGTGTGAYTLHLGIETDGGGSPDLAVGSLSTSASEVVPGERITLSATVRNRGDARSAATTIRYYRTAGGAETLLGENPIPALAPSATASDDFRAPAETAPGTYAYSACAVAVSGESNTANNCGSPVEVRVRQPSGTAASANVSYRRALGDFDGDGRDDVLLRHEDGRWFFYPMNGRRHGAGQGTANLTRNLEWSVAGVGDFNGDGRDDVLLRKVATTGTWYYYPMNGRRHLSGAGAANLPSDRSWSVAGIGDFDGDRKDDILLRHDDGRWHFYPMNGRRTATGQGTANLTRNLEWSVAGVGDLNGDGRDDVLLRKAATTGTWYYYPMNGRRHLSGAGAANLPSDRSWSVAGIGDFDGDRKDDVLLRHEDGRWHFYPMNGRRTATGQGTANLTRNLEWSVAGVGDLDGDGKDDVLLRKPATGTWYYYPMNGRRHLAGRGGANLTSNRAWGGLFEGVAEAGGLRISTESPAVRPLQAVSLAVAGGIAGADFDILVDLSGSGEFEAADTIETTAVETASGRLLMAAPLPETLAAGNAARRVAVRVRRRADEALSNVLIFTLGRTSVPASLAGRPTAILDVVLKAVYEQSDDPLLTVEAGAIQPGLSVRTARALGLSTAYSDAQAEALLRTLFGASLVAPATATGPGRSARSAAASGSWPRAVRCEALTLDALCAAYRRLTNCVGDAFDDFVSNRPGGSPFDRCARIVGEVWDEGYGERIRAIGNFFRRGASRVAGAVGGGGASARQRLFDLNAAARQAIGLQKTSREGSEGAEDAREVWENLRDTAEALTERNPELIDEAERELVGEDMDDEARDAYWNLVDEADHHQSDAAAIEELEDVYVGEADVVETLGATDAASAGGASCAGGYEEFPVDDKTATCVWRSLVEWNCYAGSRQVSHPDLGGANACLYYSLDFLQPDGGCRENYAKVRFQGRETCRWAELGTSRAAWYTLEKEHGVASPQTPVATPTPTIPDQSLEAGRVATFDLADYFADGEATAYEARSTDAEVVRVDVAGSVLTLTPIADGGATVTVTARYGDGSVARRTFSVTVGPPDGNGSGAAAGERFRDCDACPEMVVVPAGTFLMGAPESEARSFDDERPAHAVTVPSFAIGVYEVTFDEWDACVAAGGCGGYQPHDGLVGYEGWGRGRRPVINVDWDDTQRYVEWLSSRTGERYRLPSESEWEYAARAGTTTPFHTGETITSEQANYDWRHTYPSGDWDQFGHFPGQTVSVGSFGANAFGLHDVHGNVWEWVQDCWNDDYEGAPADGSAWLSDGCDERVFRGGSWNNDPGGLRAASRGRFPTGDRDYGVGFRVARTLAP